MNITDVLMLNNMETSQGAQGTGQEGSALQGDSLLFSLLLNSFKEISAPGQKSEEKQDELLAESGIDAGILGQNAYLQILQNLFPAGKEANSGILNEQGDNAVSLANEILNGLGQNEDILRDVFQDLGESIQTMKTGDALSGLAVNAEQVMADPGVRNQAVTQGSSSSQQENPVAIGVISAQENVADDFSSFPDDIGTQGIRSPISGESQSLNSRDLDQYIKTLQQLEALSGKIQLETNQKVDYEVTNDVINLSSPKNQPTDESSDVTESAEAIKSEAKPTLLTAMAQGKGHSNLSEQDSSGENGSAEKTTDWQVLNMATAKTERLNQEFDSDLRIKMPSEPGRAWEQVLDVLKKHDLQTKEIKELSIQLQPAELGKVDVSIRLENGQVHMTMNASQQATGAILQSHMQELKNGLAQMGVACGSFEMNYRQNGNGGSGNESSRQSSRYHYQADEEIPALTGNSSYLSFSDSGSRINVSA